MKNNIKHSIELFHSIEQGLEMSRELSLPSAFAYDRVSTNEQADGLNLEYQSQGAAKYAQDHNLHIVHYFTIAESASKEGRRVFNEMIDMALRFDVKHLIFKSTDRMSRNYQDLARIIDLIERQNFAIHFYQTNKVITRESSHDEKFIIGIEQAVAKHLSDKISHDIRNVNKYKVQKGIYCGQAPYGYRYDRQQKRFVIDKNTEYILRFIFDEFDTGRYSIETLRELLNRKKIAAAKGGEWSKSSVYQTLKNPFYHGEFIHDGKIMKGNHETYYDRERFEERIKRIEGNCVTDKRYKVQAPLKKFIVCECGKFMSPDIKKKQYLYYIHKCPHCDMRQISVSEEDIFSKIDKEVEKVSFSNELSALL
ncbi:MAG: recombinase family protein [Spirochaetes bacterium]|nr:recombinase family protein [Spirochaetota bacterium]